MLNIRRRDPNPIAEVASGEPVPIIELFSDTAPTVIASETQKAVYRSLSKVVASSNTRFEFFCKLTAKLDKFFSLSRASLALYEPEFDLINIPHLRVGKDNLQGVLIHLPGRGTLMKKVMEAGTIWICHYPLTRDWNEIERKILLEEHSTSLAIVPLDLGGSMLGTLNLASPAPFAFSLLESRLFNGLFANTAARLMELP